MTPYVRAALGGAVAAFATSAAVEPIPKPAREVEIIGRDYSFSAPVTLPAGATTFRFRNAGARMHEMTIVLLRAGVGPADVQATLNAKRPFKAPIESPVGMLFARPTQRSTAGLSANLIGGRAYLVICRLQDSLSLPMHAHLGMISVIHVAAGRLTAFAPSPVDTIVASNYAFHAAVLLRPGLHNIRLVNAGSVPHELNVALLKKGATLAQAVAIARVDGDLNPLVDEWQGLLNEGAHQTSAGILRLTLLPGREYLIICQFADSAKAPTHVNLGMFGAIRTSAR